MTNEKKSQIRYKLYFTIIIMTSIIKLFLTKHQIKINQVKVNNDNGSLMTTSISLQNTTFVMSTIIVILTIVIISTTLMLIIIKKKHKKPLISFNSDSKDSITFINHTFYRNKFKRPKHSSPFFIN